MMKRDIFVRYLKDVMPYEEDVEIVERKGIGHPDTICDNIAEQVSIALSKYYLDEFGSVMHHNVDKVLLVGGAASPSYNGGKIIEPIEITVAGRAVKETNGKLLPIDKIAKLTVLKWLARTLRHLDIENQIVIKVKIRQGSRDLVELFERFGKGEVPFSNDTSCGTGFYPFDELEKAVLNAEKLLNSNEIKRDYPFIGEDIKGV